MSRATISTRSHVGHFGGDQYLALPNRTGPQALPRETTVKATVMQRDILNALWRLFSSRRLTLILLTAITLVVSSSAILRQMPQGITVGSGEYGRWHAEIRAHYLQWAGPLETVGLFNISGSIWFKLPMALLILNLAVCAVEQLEAVLRRPKCSTKEFDEAFRQASQTRTLVVSGTVKLAVAKLRALLETHHYKVEVEEGEEGSCLLAQRFSLARWGTLLGHGGLIVAIGGVLLGGRLAWREEKIFLRSGQEYQIQHASSLSLRLDDFQVGLYPDGTPHYYRAQLTLLEQEDELATGIVEPNAPLQCRGMAFYQCSHGPAISIKGLDAQGEPVSLQALVPGGALQEEATVQLSEDENEGYIAVPEQNLILRLVFHPHLPRDTREIPALLVQAYRGGLSDLVFGQTLFGSASFRVEGTTYALEWGHYAVLAIVRDPGFTPIMMGAASLLVAAIVTLYLPPRYIWATVSGKEWLVEMQLVRVGEGDKGVGATDFEVLMGQVEKRLL